MTCQGATAWLIFRSIARAWVRTSSHTCVGMAGFRALDQEHSKKAPSFETLRKKCES